MQNFTSIENLPATEVLDLKKLDSSSLLDSSFQLEVNHYPNK